MLALQTLREVSNIIREISNPARGKGYTGKGFGISYNLKRVYYAFLLLPKPSSPMALIDRTAHVHVQIP